MKIIFLRFKSVHRLGIYGFNFNREISRLRKLDELFNKKEPKINFDLDHKSEESPDNPTSNHRLEVNNLYFCFIIILFGINIALLCLVVEKISYLFGRTKIKTLDINENFNIIGLVGSSEASKVRCLSVAGLPLSELTITGSDCINYLPQNVETI
jgi:hypothetical protein